MRMDECLDALVQREQTTHAEQDESDDECPEVALVAETELVLCRRLSLCTFAPQHQQCLVAGVGERVGGLGEQAGGTGDEKADELGDRDAEVGEECCEYRSAAALMHRARLPYPLAEAVMLERHEGVCHMGWMDGRIALVSGGGRGIGRGISELLAANGATVAVNYRRDRDAAEDTVRSIEQAGGSARAYEASVDDADADAAMVDSIVNDFGHIDLLVCNAGIASRGLRVSETDPSEMIRVVATHAFSAHHLSRLVLPSMRTQPRGDIIMISSVATSHMGANGAPYNMGKAALEALALTLAKEERQNGIHVNIVAPGLVETDMGVRLARAMTGNRELEDLRALDRGAPFGHVCQPDDVAKVVLWLCSDGAGYVTGQRVECDGGGSR